MTKTTKQHNKAPAESSESAISNPLVVVERLSKAEQTLIQSHATAVQADIARRPPALVDVPIEKLGKFITTIDPSKDKKLAWAQLSAATGSPQRASTQNIFVDLFLIHESNTGKSATELTGALAHMLDIAPRDGLEGMLAAQMVGVHRVAMRTLASAAKSTSVELAGDLVNQATKLMRLFTLQMDCLSRGRGKGPSEQVVRVERVTVQAGAQAVIGNVSSTQRHPEGGG